MTQDVRWGPPVVDDPAASAGRRRAEGPDEPAPLRDPYWMPPKAPATPATSQLAVTGLLTLLLGPVGSIASILFGWAARREIARARGARRGLWIANAAIALGVVFSIGWGGGATWYLAQRHRLRASELASGDREPDTASDPAIVTPEPSGAPDPGASGTPLPSVVAAPKVTKTTRIGGIPVVDVGKSEPSLQDELARLRADASKTGESVLVMTTAGHCDPCRGVDRSLKDPLLQSALEKVRLVRIHVAGFHHQPESFGVLA